MHLIAGDDRHPVRHLHMLALEDLRERDQRHQPGLSVVDHHGQFVGEAVLAGCQHHAAAAVSSLHGRCEPDVVEGTGHAVDRHVRAAGFEIVKHALDRDRGVVDLLAGRFSLLIRPAGILGKNVKEKV